MQLSCSPRRLQSFFIFVAAVTIVTVLIVLFLFSWPSFARQRIIDNLIFKEGTLGMENFKTTANMKNLRISLTLFTVTNPEQVIKSSSQIQVKEIGPFVYYELKTKEFTDNDQTSGLISYKLRKRFTFKPELSVGDPSKINITWVNIPVISAIASINQLSFYERIPARIVLNRAISNVQEKPFMTDSVENFIFSGSYRALFAQPLLAPFVPKKLLPDDKFAILYNRNNTWLPERDYVITAAAGFGPNQTYRDLNQFVYLNGSSHLNFWGEKGNCNDLRGTDGQFFSPFLNASQNLEVYSPDICRKLAFKFRGEADVDGVTTLKYTLDEKSLQSQIKNLDNACYCIGDPSIDCSLDGLIDLSSCSNSNGVVASGAHFIHGSPELVTRIDGLTQPNITQDAPTIYVEPNTGLPVQVKVPIQINAKLKRTDGYKIFNFFKEDNPLIIPLLTMTEAGSISDEQGTMLRNKLLILDSWFVSMVLGGAIVLILMIIIVIFVVCVIIKNSRHPIQVTREPSEADPLLQSANISSRS